ncbi:hypothetical protein HNV12_02720 [Methanococcoides sp. SA1]|nr:hypothetical protein [Methanococcoides sp. SA1]
MINDKAYIMDVFYKPIEGFAPAIVDVHKNWDGSLYAETNVKDLTGPNRTVIGQDRRTGSPDMLVATIDGVSLNAPEEIPHWY